MKQKLLFIISVFIAWLPVFAIQKPVFMFYQHSLSQGYSLSDFWKVIYHGLKLDCTIAGYLTVLPLLLTLVAVWISGKWLKQVLKIYFLVMAIAVAAIFSVDIALYGFWGFRLDATLFFYLQSPADAMASVPWGLFFLQLSMFAIYAILIYTWFKFILRFTPTKEFYPPTGLEQLRTSAAIILLGGILFIPIRGGLTTSTANIGMVYFSQKQFLNHAAINPCFSLIASLSKQQDFAKQFNFYPEEKRKAIFERLMKPHISNTSLDSLNISNKTLNTDRPNILIIILESFTANAIEAVGGEPGITPNLNALSKEGVLFSNLYANSFRTDRGLVAVLNGYLAQPTTSIMKYPAKSQSLPSIAKSLAREGYEADMLYGGDINFTNMQSYFFSSGYSKITSDKDFPINSRLNKWGANDDITFKHLLNMMRQRETSDKPWMTTFLTLSSHEPFDVPLHRLQHPFLNSVAFTDSCLGNFIDQMKKLPLWENTLVILVADHGYKYPEDMAEYGPLRFHIPMLWIGGAIKEPKVIDVLGNQTDLAATLLHQMNLSGEEYSFSKDLLDPLMPHYAFYSFNNGFGFIDSTGISVFDNDGEKTLIETPDSGHENRLEKGKVLLQTLYDDLGNR